MRTLLLSLALAGIMGCSSAPVSNTPEIPDLRFAVGDRVMTPSGPGTITMAAVRHLYRVKLDNKDEEGNAIEGSWSENPLAPFDGVKKLEQ